LKLLKKEKKKWSHEVKHSTTTDKMKVANLTEKTFTKQTSKHLLQHQCHLSDKVNLLFTPRHARHMNSRYQTTTLSEGDIT